MGVRLGRVWGEKNSMEDDNVDEEGEEEQINRWVGGEVSTITNKKTLLSR